jgi:hypothetical protein
MAAAGASLFSTGMAGAGVVLCCTTMAGAGVVQTCAMRSAGSSSSSSASARYALFLRGCLQSLAQWPRRPQLWHVSSRGPSLAAARSSLPSPTFLRGGRRRRCPLLRAGLEELPPWRPFILSSHCSSVSRSLPCSRAGSGDSRRSSAAFSRPVTSSNDISEVSRRVSIARAICDNLGGTTRKNLATT